jgi:signal transduction histidine kinase
MAPKAFLKTFHSNQSLRELSKEDLGRQQEFLGIIAWVCLAVLILASLPAIYYQAWVILYPIGTFSVCLCLVLYLNIKGYVITAGNILSFTTSVLLFFVCLLQGKGTGGYLYFLPLIVVIPYLVNCNNNCQLIIHILHPTLFSLLINFGDFSPRLPQLSSDFQDLYTIFNFGFVVFLCQFFVYQIVSHNTENTYQLLSSKQLLRSRNDELVKINKELDRFVYSISHELRAPVASALGLGDIIQDEKDLEEIQKYNTIMIQNLQRLDSLMNDILDYSRNARYELKADCISFEKEIQAAVQQCQFICTDVRVTTHVHQATDFFTDAYRFRLVLNNLVSNAFRYQNPAESSKQIVISCEVCDKKAVLKVKDNGIGIAAEDQKYVFEMFYRAGNQLPQSKPGTGLGLYITKESLQKIGGSINVDSQIGHFTEFSVEIPSVQYLKTVRGEV